MRLLLVLLLLPAAAYALTPLDAGIMDARILISNTVQFHEEGIHYDVTGAQGQLFWYPREDYLQAVIDIETTPQAELSDAGYLFVWDTPKRSEDIELSARFTTHNSIVQVKEDIPFPLQDIPAELQEYLVEGPIIDQTPAIQSLAQDLARDKDDAYEVVFALADWTTTNIEYSLASLGEPAIQTSSQVLASKWGKCDEMTALFISLNRALGIPARFVAGYSYTNSDLLAREWGGHGWAEVWFPGTGWVPFDMTYGEYGYLDAGHVKLRTSPDVNSRSIAYSASGRDFSIEAQSVDIVITPTDLVGQYEERIKLSLEAPRNNVGFGSAVLILAQIENNRDHYVATRLELTQVTGTQALSDVSRNVLLKPHEKRIVPFLIRIKSDLDPRLRYEFGFKVGSRLGAEEEVVISASSGLPVYSAAEFASEIESYEGFSAIKGSLSVTCDRGETKYTGETSTHHCMLDRQALDITVCEKVCTTIPVENKEFTLDITQESPGTRTLRYTASAAGEETNFLVTSRRVDTPLIEATIDAPGTISPEETALIDITLTGTGAEIRNATLTLTAGHAHAEQSTGKLTSTRFALPGTALRPGMNTVIADIIYVDELGTSASMQEEIAIELTDVGVSTRIKFWLEDIGYFFEGLFS